MNVDKQAVPKFSSYDEIAEFWETHSTADYWDQTHAVEFEIAPQARRQYLVAVDPDLLMRIQQLAQRRGITTESFVNLLLEQRLHQLEAQPA
jgi:predicted DNA binding CopG/RHH family protein